VLKLFFQVVGFSVCYPQPEWIDFLLGAGSMKY